MLRSVIIIMRLQKKTKYSKSFSIALEYNIISLHSYQNINLPQNGGVNGNLWRNWKHGISCKMFGFFYKFHYDTKL